MACFNGTKLMIQWVWHVVVTICCSHSDGDAVHGDSAAVDTVDLSILKKSVMEQHRMLCELKEIQERNLLTLQDQISEVKSSAFEEQKAELSGLLMEQRILSKSS
jgi:hypothetical protein